MSVLFPKVNKAPEWNWRPIYYDPKKDEMDRKLRELQAKRAAEEQKEGEKGETPQYSPTLHRGSFRESHQENMTMSQKARRSSRIGFLIALLALLLFTFYFLL